MHTEHHNPGMIPMLAGAMGAPLTMSSREIAELVESRHDDVKRSIKRLADRGVIIQPPMADEQDTDAMGRKRTTSVYQLEKRDSFVVVAQLSPEFTARLVDRWQELEEEKANGGFSIPRSFGEALRLAAEQHEEIEAMKPVVAAMARLGSSEGSVIPRVAAKALGVAEKKFFQWLYSHNWAFKQGKTWQAYAEKMKQGYLEHETVTYLVEETGQERTKVQLKITPKGMARLAQIFAKEGAAA
ncbi:DNA-binding protein [Xinfangfangia sp. D13-10-4-6]|uniref:phage antirepressor KilAC domain-containing protein n=1 Tax=Pseudogemmobacter hezensis TaxID=2737662 RepID=UPI0015580EC9|nr:phage antirepressor KilAC domain-containing protein [Pseudogemmobacter hezensis]NPD17608.1 DNA-binding protein [Pseudogemmobacter hezensis]